MIISELYKQARMSKFLNSSAKPLYRSLFLGSQTSIAINCSFGWEDSAVCGPFGANSTILSLVKCEEDMTSHLISLSVSSKRGRRSVPTLSESNLILNRTGLFGLGLQRTGEMTICPKHRQELTVDWAGRKSSTCSYPSHRGPRKQMKNVRRINISEEVFARYQISVPIGSGKQ